MGCASSRPPHRKRYEGPLPSTGRGPSFRKRLDFSYSLPISRRRRETAATRQHVVSLTSSTLGSLCLDRDGEVGDEGRDGESGEAMMKRLNDGKGRIEEEGNGMAASNEPEVINTWELMEGLDFEDVSPMSTAVTRTLSLPAERPMDVKDHCNNITNEERNGSTTKLSLVKERINAFQEKINARRALALANAARQKCPPNCDGKVILYFTSLRSVRKTYEECCEVLVILRGYGVWIDERDVSMHGGFKEELSRVLGAVPGGIRLPRVFANGRYLGGAEEVRQLHETGELLEALKGCAAPLAMKGGTASCAACGDVRFVPCKVCSGSCKVFVDGGSFDQEAEKGGEHNAGFGFRRCAECNENGLVRCPVCCAGWDSFRKN